MEFEETVFITGMTGKLNSFSVSPDGTRILVGRKKFSDGLQLLDLKNGQISKIPTEAGRTWGMPNWSPDGKQVVAISTAIRENKYQVGEQEIILIDPRDWRYHKLAATSGVNIFPFFSADGKTVYYFKGKKRENGKTLASDYALYAYDLVENQETRLTPDNMHQVDKGYDNGAEIMFSVHGFLGKPVFEEGLYVLNKTTLQLRPVDVDQSNGFFMIYFGDKDAAGNIYFKAAKNRPSGGNFLWFVYRCDAQGNSCIMTRETTIRSWVQVASDTGEIFIDDVVGGEIVFRRLIEKPKVQ
ncbi:MAG: hypothetical protein LBJ59_09440 [Zoogloeaceae bacterium]|nr:hypothetical protein [Zoogloeaceae bacterium]